jgi:hypothetical protein
MSFLTGTYAETIWCNDASGTSRSSFTTEVAINDLAGCGPQPYLPAGFYQPGARKRIAVKARGLMSSASSGGGNFTVTLRLATSAAATSGTIALGSAAWTPATSLSSVMWELEGEFTSGDLSGSAATSLRGTGLLTVNETQTASRIVPLWANAASPGTTTFDPTLSYFLTLNAACTVSNASNLIQLLDMQVMGLN